MGFFFSTVSLQTKIIIKYCETKYVVTVLYWFGAQTNLP